MLNPPGSYCAYASVYLTVCLIRIFGLATKTYLEQQLHVGIIQVRAERTISRRLSRRERIVGKDRTDEHQTVQQRCDTLNG